MATELRSSKNKLELYCYLTNVRYTIKLLWTDLVLRTVVVRVASVTLVYSSRKEPSPPIQTEPQHYTKYCAPQPGITALNRGHHARKKLGTRNQTHETAVNPDAKTKNGGNTPYPV